jgi:hypothetical protein
MSIDRIVLGQHANTELGAGLFISNPGANVLDPLYARGGNLAFDSSGAVMASMHVIQSGSFTIECNRVPIPYAANLTSYTGSHGIGWMVEPDLDSDGALGAPGGVYLDTGSMDIPVPSGLPEGVIPEIALRFAVGNSSGHFHPWYANTVPVSGFEGTSTNYMGGNWNHWEYGNSKEIVHMDSPWVRFKWGGKSIQTMTQDDAQFTEFVVQNNLATLPLYDSDGNVNLAKTPEEKYKEILHPADTAYGRLKGATGLIYFANSTNLHVEAHMTPTHSGLRTPTRENIRQINESLAAYKAARPSHLNLSENIKYPELNALWTNAIDDLAHFAYPTSPNFTDTLYDHTKVFRADGTSYGRGTYYMNPYGLVGEHFNKNIDFSTRQRRYRWMGESTTGLWGGANNEISLQKVWGNLDSFNRDPRLGTSPIPGFPAEPVYGAYFEANDLDYPAVDPTEPALMIAHGEGVAPFTYEDFGRKSANEFGSGGWSYPNQATAFDVVIASSTVQNITDAVAAGHLVQPTISSLGFVRSQDNNLSYKPANFDQWPGILTDTSPSGIQANEMNISSPQNLTNMNIWENGQYVDECWPGHFGHKENFYQFLAYEEFITKEYTSAEAGKGFSIPLKFNWGQTPVLKSAWTSLWNYDSLNYDSHAPFARAKNPDGWYGHPSEFFVNPFSNATLTFNTHFPPPYDPTYTNPRSDGRLGLYDYKTKDVLAPGPRNTYAPLSNPTRPQTGLNAWLEGHHTDVARFGSGSGDITHSPGLNFEALSDHQGSMGLGGAGSKTSLKSEDCWNTYYCSYVLFGHTTSTGTLKISEEFQKAGVGPGLPHKTYSFTAASKTVPSYNPSTFPVPRSITGPLGDIYQEQKHGSRNAASGKDYGHNRYTGGLAWTNLVFPDDFVGTVGDPGTDPFHDRRDSSKRIYGNVDIILNFPKGEFYGSTRFNYKSVVLTPDPVITLDFSDDKWNRSGGGDTGKVNVKMLVGGVMIGGGGAGGGGSKNTDGLGAEVIIDPTQQGKNQLVQQYDEEGNPIVRGTYNTLRQGGGGGHGGAGSYLDNLFMSVRERNQIVGGSDSVTFDGDYPAPYKRFHYAGVGASGPGWGTGILTSDAGTAIPLAQIGKTYGADVFNTGQHFPHNPSGLQSSEARGSGFWPNVNGFASNWRTTLNLTGSLVSPPGDAGLSPPSQVGGYVEPDPITGEDTLYFIPHADNHTYIVQPTAGGNGGDVVHVIANPELHPLIDLEIIAMDGSQIASGAGGMGGGIGEDASEIPLQPAGTHGLMGQSLTGFTDQGVDETETLDAGSHGRARGGFAGYLVSSPDKSYTNPVLVRNENKNFSKSGEVSIAVENYIGGPAAVSPITLIDDFSITRTVYDSEAPVGGADHGWPTQIKARDSSITQAVLVYNTDAEAITTCWLLNGATSVLDPTRPMQSNGEDHFGSRYYFPPDPYT